MKTTTFTALAAAAAAVGIVLAGCGSNSDTAPKAGSSSAATSTTSSQTSAQAAPTSQAGPSEDNAPGPNPTIATYIKQNGISETPIKRDTPGAPKINLTIPAGWKDAGKDTPKWAYGAYVYTGPEAAEYTPSIVALVSKLTGDVDPQKIIDLAPGELKNLPGYEPLSEGTQTKLDNYQAFQLGGMWMQDGKRKVVAQKTVVIPAADGVYVLQLNADGLEDQVPIIASATDAIDKGTTITT